MDLEHSPAWGALTKLHAQHHHSTIAEHFALDPKRAARLSIQHDGLLFDYSKTGLTDSIKAGLIALADQQALDTQKNAMFSGAHINNSEDRAVMHVALRAPRDAAYHVDGRNISDDIHDTLDHMRRFCDTIHKGEWRGHNGQPIKTIVHIGIGGSDLGPYMVCDALKDFALNGMNIHFVSNVDGAALHNCLGQINPDETLFLIASKSFTTEETLKNAESAKAWFLKTTGAAHEAIAKHFAAMTVNVDAAVTFGIDADNIFGFGAYVGGRFSLWSSIGLPIALYLGFDHFTALLNGAHAMDQHFLHAPNHENLPVLLGLIGIWHRNFCAYESLAILPYAQNLTALPAYLQQMDMESNGKTVDRNGRDLPYATGPVIFGASGTNGQHAFYQLIHQSQTIIPCEFIAFKTALSPLQDHHDALLCHVLAQSRALMIGRKSEATAPEKHFSGNRPSTTLIVDALSPYHLGQILALYEHKIFVQGAIWGLNSYDQPGVELGKILAKEIATALPAIKNGQSATTSFDPSTQNMLDYLFKN